MVPRSEHTAAGAHQLGLEPRAARRVQFVVGLLAFALGLGGCLVIGPDGGRPTGTGTGPISTAPAGDGGPRMPTEEIWSWALGLAWDDPAIAAYTKDFGRARSDWGDDPTGHVRSEGFSLDLDAAGRVRSVTVYADESALGLGSGYAAYRGALPLGLSWSHTATRVYAALGSPASITGGFGFDVVWTYVRDGLRAELGFWRATGSPDRLAPTAPLHRIQVSRA